MLKYFLLILSLFPTVFYSRSLSWMEKGKGAVNEATSALRNLQLHQPIPKSNPSRMISNFLYQSQKKSKPRKLVSLCIGFLGQHLEDITSDISDISVAFPPDIKLAIMAIARRRKLLNDEVLIALADPSWKLLDVSGSDITDFGLVKIANLCTNLRAIDISRCEKVTASGVSEIICNCTSLETLRCGGSPRSNFTIRRSLSLFKPKLNFVEEDSWEELDCTAIGNGAQSLKWLIWPKIDEDSKSILETECPRIIVNPQPSPIGFHGIHKVPIDAITEIPLDHSILEDIDPKTWSVPVSSSSVNLRRNLNPAPLKEEITEIPIAERFRLAFVERDARLAPKRAKNERQRRRREEREYWMSNADAKSVALASQAGKFMRK
ncbi:hypothetical protein LUZ60_017393 [Juncus effusus]|nr:hypothetical protein LUZ60_017393 [Juncus effusus]